MDLVREMDGKSHNRFLTHMTWVFFMTRRKEEFYV